MTTYSTNVNNPELNINQAFNVLIAEEPTFISMVLRESGGFPIPDGQGGYTNLTPMQEVAVGLQAAPSYYWINQTLNPTRTTLTANSNTGGTTLTVASTAGIYPNSILGFSSSTGVSRTVLVMVTAVNSATSLTVIRPFAGTTDQNLVSTDIVDLISIPQGEGSTDPSNTFDQGVQEFNYTQIFSQMIKMSETSMYTKAYDQATSTNKQARVAAVKMLRDMDRSLIRGRRFVGTDPNNPNVPLRAAGGLAQYINAGSGTNIVNTGTLSLDAIYTLQEQIFLKGGGVNASYVILGNTKQLQKLTALNTQGSNPIVQKTYTDAVIGGPAITVFQGNLPIMGLDGTRGGMTAQVYVSTNVPQDMLYILDMNQIAVKFLRPIKKTTDVTVEDSQTTRLITELTYEIKQAASSHGVITGLSVA